MSSLFPSSLFSNRLGNSVRLPFHSVLFRKTAADVCLKQEKGAAKDKLMSFSLLVDVMLFCFILAVDAALTAENFLRSRFAAKESTPAGKI